jgi:CcmD family protein
MTATPLAALPLPSPLLLRPAWITALGPATGSPEDRSTEFVAVEGGRETTSAEGLLVTAYFVMWAALLGFIFLTWRRQGKLEARLEGIHGELGRLGSRGDKVS